MQLFYQQQLSIAVGNGNITQNLPYGAKKRGFQASDQQHQQQTGNRKTLILRHFLRCC